MLTNFDNNTVWLIDGPKVETAVTREKAFRMNNDKSIRLLAAEFERI